MVCPFTLKGREWMATPNDAQTILRPLRLVRYAGELTSSPFGTFAGIFVQAAAPVEHAE